jgi:homoserine kinase type II
LSLRALSREDLRTILSLYHLEGLEDFGPSFGALDGSYWVRASGHRYLLRVSGRRAFRDMLFEKDLVAHLRQAGLPVPRPILNVASGAFTPWESRGRWVCLFDDLPGRSLGVFEVRTRHARAIGEFLARMHRAVVSFASTRESDAALDALEEKLDRLEIALAKKRLAIRFAPDVELLSDELELQRGREPGGPAAITHSDLSVSNVRFVGDKLTGVIDFERACKERLMSDLALAISAWCWEPSVRQMGGPAGRFSGPKVKALLSAYSAIRAPDVDELKELELDLRLAALRFSLARMVEHELPASSRTAIPYRDYRHHLARLVALRSEARPISECVK